MAVQLTTPQEDQCAHHGCDTTYSVPNAVQGSYCSAECADRSDGRRVLRHLEQDHTFCGSCYKPRKVIYRPDETRCPEFRKKALLIRESFVGYETLTEHADRGAYGIECECGAVSHDLDLELCRNGEPYEWYLKLAIEHCRTQGVWDYHLNLEAFLDAIWTTDALEHALGHALHTPE